MNLDLEVLALKYQKWVLRLENRTLKIRLHDTHIAPRKFDQLLHPRLQLSSLQQNPFSELQLLLIGIHLVRLRVPRSDLLPLLDEDLLVPPFVILDILPEEVSLGLQLRVVIVADRTSPFLVRC